MGRAGLRNILGPSLLALAAALAANNAAAQTAPPADITEVAADPAPDAGQRYTPADFPVLLS
jgi:hypothetical protein